MVPWVKIPLSHTATIQQRHATQQPAARGPPMAKPFRVNRQVPERSEAPQPFTTVLNCRQAYNKKGHERKSGGEIRSERVPLFRVGDSPPQDSKRKRDADNGPAGDSVCDSESKEIYGLPSKRRMIASASSCRAPKPKLLGKGRNRVAETDICDDVWLVIIEHLEPAQLFKSYKEISMIYRHLRRYKTYWRKNRIHYYGEDIPEPPEGLSEFQYSDLLHGRSCQQCRLEERANTRKTYWAFLRRWCKTCLHVRTIEHKEALDDARKVANFPEHLLKTCLKSAQTDSWGNYLGVGGLDVFTATGRPSSAVKVVYLKSELKRFLTEFGEKREQFPPLPPGPEDDGPSLSPEMEAWLEERRTEVASLREFALHMEDWELAKREKQSKDYRNRRDARKTYFMERALKLHFSPSVEVAEVERSTAFKNSMAISKWPNPTAWQALRPKLERDIKLARQQRKSRGRSHPPAQQTARVITAEDTKDEELAAVPTPLATPQSTNANADLPVLLPPTLVHLPPILNRPPGAQQPPLTMEPRNPWQVSEQQYGAVCQSSQHEGLLHNLQQATYQSLQHGDTWGSPHEPLFQDPQHAAQFQTPQHGHTFQTPQHVTTPQYPHHGAVHQSPYPERRLPPIPALSHFPSKPVGPLVDYRRFDPVYQNMTTMAVTHNTNTGGYMNHPQYQYSAPSNTAEGNIWTNPWYTTFASG